MLVEVKKGHRWVQKEMSEWDIEVKEGSKWISLGRLNQEKQKAKHAPHQHKSAFIKKTGSVRASRMAEVIRPRRVEVSTYNARSVQNRSTQDHRVRYCMLCHCVRRRSPCVECGKPTLLPEQMEQAPEEFGGRNAGRFFIQGGRPDSNRRRH